MINILAIDPGMGGGIALKHKNTSFTWNMPKTNLEFRELLDRIEEDYGKFICFIERVQMWVGDADSGNRGKHFRIVKMTNQYNALIAIMEARMVPINEVAPITWQKELNLFFPKEEKQVRKNKYKRFAQKKFPLLKPTLKTSDALCILQYGIQIVTLRPSHFIENIKNKETLTLFS